MGRHRTTSGRRSDYRCAVSDLISSYFRCSSLLSLTALAIKYADTVTKGFALSVSILLSFLLSVVLFDFPISTPSVAGGLLVVGATILFEVDSSSLGQLLQRPYSLSDYRKPALKRWHFAIPLLITSLITIFPSPRSSITSTARDIVHQFDTSYHPPPTIALADMGAINDRLAASATNDCRWGITPRRATTTSPYGAHPPQDRVSTSSPRFVFCFAKN